MIRGTSVDDIVLVKVVDGVEDLLYGLGGILLGEFALVADSIEEFAAGSKLRDDIELVLRKEVSSGRDGIGLAWRVAQTLDSNQSTNWTMCGCFSLFSMPSSS